ncbi:hypothetical protein CLU79DRAFT_838499 [Phycomyces nitens]|nr:hypothetical protein CLU79DRAFT_838499 [Phycomyces nitens]
MFRLLVWDRVLILDNDDSNWPVYLFQWKLIPRCWFELWSPTLAYMHRLDISESCGNDDWILSKLPMFTLWVSGLVLLAAGVCVVEVLGYILPQYQRTIESRSMDVSPSDIRRSYVSELDGFGFLTGSCEPLVGFGLSCVDFCESVD